MKKPKKLIWQLYPSYLLIILISLGAVSFYASNSLENFFLKQTFSELKVQARMLEKQVKPAFNPINQHEINQICKDIGEAIDTRLTIMLIDGTIIGDSDENPQNMDNHRDRPEVVEANQGRIGRSIRYSRTMKQRMMYVAMPLKSSNSIIAILRTSIALDEVDEQISSIRLKLFLDGLFIALIASGICYFVSRRIVKPIEMMQQFAEHFARGKLTDRLVPPNTKELSSLAKAMNQMASQLVLRIETIKKHKNEYEAVLTSMVEGVIAIDTDERVLGLNQSAAKIFDAVPDMVEKRSLQEVIRNRDLQNFVGKALKSKENLDGEVTFVQNEEKFYRVHASPLCDAKSEKIGVLLVLDDITQLRRLEKIRQDFVANASHEIKTPLTAIKGFVETLLNGAMTDKEKSVHFLNIIDKHVNRLSAIVQDLLLLSTIEREDEINQLIYQEINIKDIIKSSISICLSKAVEKKITMDFEPLDDTIMKVDQRLIEQALVNLLDNAIKYSPEKSKISVIIEKSQKEIKICVTDQGNGISKDHLSRLFERFYRVDRARSRKLGGTGLGLSIVKHIAQAHKGKVSVESTLGQGSTFTIHLPMVIDMFKERP
ncbi:multi-sensor signal transduction histidine kinase [Candidatus Magnetomorum sp. HK-1]|nr:multi-sensor signal transduction histidine kinase [Candidatus Magnetomorum sp. HK-1]